MNFKCCCLHFYTLTQASQTSPVSNNRLITSAFCFEHCGRLLATFFTLRFAVDLLEKPTLALFVILIVFALALNFLCRSVSLCLSSRKASGSFSLIRALFNRCLSASFVSCPAIFFRARYALLRSEADFAT